MRYRRHRFIRCTKCRQLTRIVMWRYMPLNVEGPYPGHDCYWNNDGCRKDGKACDWEDVTEEIHAEYDSKPLEFLHPSDPEVQWDAFRVSFAYMHLKAEEILEAEGKKHEDWREEAPDLFVPNKPITIPGIYYGTLYGHDAVLVVGWQPSSRFAPANCMRGRGALLSDERAVKHCLELEKWC